MIVPMAGLMALMTLGGFVPQSDPHAQHQAGMDHRGNQAMGFDQAKIQHTFAAATQGGSIQVVAKDPKDATTISQIRSHLRDIAKLFKAGDFSKPLFIHARTPPGTDVMTARRADIDYRSEEIPAGGRLSVASANVEAVAAIQAYLRYQQEEHKR
jgi:hypothetical protein